MNCYRSKSLKWGASLFAALLVGLCAAQSSHAVVLLDDSYEDELFLSDPNGGEVPNLPDETIFWVGRPGDAIEGNGAGAARYLMNASSQKGWWNFVEGNDTVHLNNGDSLRVVVDFIPRGVVANNTSRNWRLGIYGDPTDPVVEQHTNSDGGGGSAPFTDAVGYSVFINMTGDAGTTEQQIGKRTNQASSSLLGTSNDHTMISGGSHIAFAANNEYSIDMLVTRVSNTLNTFTMSIYDVTGGNALLSTQTVNDDGTLLGTGARPHNFDFVGFRNANLTTSFAAFDFTRIYIEGPAAVPEPTTLLLGALVVPLALLRRKR